MGMTLYQRLALSLLAVFMTMALLLFWYSGELRLRSQQEAEQRLHLGLAGHLVHDNPLLSQGLYDHDALENLFHTLMLLGPSFEFYYLDARGEILAYSAEPGKVKRDRVDLAPIQQLLVEGSSLPVLGDDPRNLERRKIFSAAPVYQGESLQGYLYMIIGGERLDSIFAEVSRHQSLKKYALFGISTLLLLLALLLLLFRLFTKPLQRLSRDMHAFRQGGFWLDTNNKSQWHADSHNEIQQLGCAFHQMASQIQQQMEQLKSIDEHRRVLLADLSHDLRTPLANLQGYIETLALKDNALADTDRRRFLDISLRNAQNLKTLIDQIFELAYLEGGQVTLKNEAFALADLLYDVVAKFTLKAQERNIRLAVEPTEFQGLVVADIEKLERVLTNLLENAIRHTPKGGQITLRAAFQGERVRVDVQDTGQGISQQELAYIFNARYQASNTRSDKVKHVGLGLAISKKLMALLDSELTVQSEVGKGTCFSFELHPARGA
ncbi:HAMP domain-containing sensor histidine kinase [Aliiglaciecola sp. CAU 1673]|uniref:sensor histidine kinase n=1 Tax=Aliiglaciecola sp. CAU 1673 TaxID=3032595 RepID=UPI0023DB3927|nr:HAMP domain-containing sensor histidine kinase [Aliiglaciecola sp. CAU 1673]MDF2177783.1 HAMP domain-containing sensor histidine kinase [Aliiglaciecola sp. CAU 1673]